jgi:hypothetical protein
MLFFPHQPKEQDAPRILLRQDDSVVLERFCSTSVAVQECVKIVAEIGIDFHKMHNCNDFLHSIFTSRAFLIAPIVCVDVF